MGRIKLLDCTLRDGGYVNDWSFGIDVIEKCIYNLEKSRADILEIGFLKDEKYKKDRTVYNDVYQISEQICPKKPNRLYAAMIEVVNPIPLDMLKPCSDDTVDMIRVIVWKTKHDKDGKEVDALQEGFRYCKGVVEKGYKLSVQPARVDQYSKEEFIDMVKLFNTINPYAFYIVDSWGTQTPESIMSYVELADKYLNPGIAIGYHGHDNKNQALQIAKAVCTAELDRDIIIDASVNGIGRGAGNLDSGTIAQYLNKHHNMDYAPPYFDYIGGAYIAPIYNYAKWGKTLPFFMTAERNCNPNYAQYYDFELHLPLEDIEGILDLISDEDKIIYSEKRAKKYLRKYRKSKLDLAVVVPTCNRSASVDYLLFTSIRDLWYFGIDIIICDSSSDRKTEAIVNNFILDGYDNVFYKHCKCGGDASSSADKMIEAYKENLEHDYIWMIYDGIVPNIAAVYNDLLKITKPAKKPNFIAVDASFRNNDTHSTKTYDDCAIFFSDNALKLADNGGLIVSGKAVKILTDKYPVDNENRAFWQETALFDYLAESDEEIVSYIGDVFSYNANGIEGSFRNNSGDNFWQWCLEWYKSISNLPSVYDEYKANALKLDLVDFHPFYLFSLLNMRGNNNLNMKLVRQMQDVFPYICDTPMWKFRLAARMPKWLARNLVNKPHSLLHKIYHKLLKV